MFKIHQQDDSPIILTECLFYLDDTLIQHIIEWFLPISKIIDFSEMDCIMLFWQMEVVLMCH